MVLLTCAATAWGWGPAVPLILPRARHAQQNQLASGEMQVRRDTRVARGSFSGAARHVNAILLSSERRRSPRDFGSREGHRPVCGAPLWPLRDLCAISRQKRTGGLAYRHTS